MEMNFCLWSCENATPVSARTHFGATSHRGKILHDDTKTIKQHTLANVICASHMRTWYALCRRNLIAEKRSFIYDSKLDQAEIICNKTANKRKHISGSCKRFVPNNASIMQDMVEPTWCLRTDSWDKALTMSRSQNNQITKQIELIDVDTKTEIVADTMTTNSSMTNIENWSRCVCNLFRFVWWMCKEEDGRIIPRSYNTNVHVHPIIWIAKQIASTSNEYSCRLCRLWRLVCAVFCHSSLAVPWIRNGYHFWRIRQIWQQVYSSTPDHVRDCTLRMHPLHKIITYIRNCSQALARIRRNRTRASRFQRKTDWTTRNWHNGSDRFQFRPCRDLPLRENLSTPSMRAATHAQASIATKQWMVEQPWTYHVKLSCREHSEYCNDNGSLLNRCGYIMHFEICNTELRKQYAYSNDANASCVISMRTCMCSHSFSDASDHMIILWMWFDAVKCFRCVWITYLPHIFVEIEAVWMPWFQHGRLACETWASKMQHGINKHCKTNV